MSRCITVLHIAPEPVLTSFLTQRPNVDYVSGDLEPGRAMEIMDITALPRPADTFDLVLCNHVLEHIPDDRKAMSEIRRVLKPGGVAFMQHPIDNDRAHTHEQWNAVTPETRMREFGQEDHVRLYGVDFIDRLREAGFQVTRRRYLDEIAGAVRERYALRDGRPGAGMRGADIFECVAAK